MYITQKMSSGDHYGLQGLLEQERVYASVKDNYGNIAVIRMNKAELDGFIKDLLSVQYLTYGD